MDQTPVTIDLDLPADLADEFERYAREEQLTESQLFIRMFSFYSSLIKSIREPSDSQDDKRLEEMVLEGLESGSGMTLDSPEWDEFWKRIEERIGEKNAGISPEPRS